MPGEMGAFGNKHLLEMERWALILRMCGPCPTLRCYLMQNTNIISFLTHDSQQISCINTQNTKRQAVTSRFFDFCFL